MKVALGMRFAVALTSCVGAAAAVAGPLLDLSRTEVDFGRTPQNITSQVQPVWVTNTGDALLVISGLTILGVYSSDFALGGTCTPPATLQPNERCRIEVTVRLLAFLPTLRSGTVSLASNAPGSPASIPVSATVDNGSPQNPATSLFVDSAPDWLDFAPQSVGTSSPTQGITVANTGNLTFNLAAMSLAGGDAGDFTMTTSCVLGQVVAPGQGCTATVTFAPLAVGPRSTELEVDLTYLGIHGVGRYSITGVGTGPLTPSKVAAIEYFHAQIGHYFLTAQADEQFGLDNQLLPGWVRTGNQFNVWDSQAAGTSAVFRLFTVKFASKAAHFYTADSVERDGRRTENGGDWTYEKVAYFLKATDTGVCGAGEVPIYRMFNDGQTGAPNHRFTTSLATYQDFTTTKGWLGEGIRFCAPA